MFIDVAHITVKGGKGGDGAVAWRREKFEPAGGPAGGNGGDGGNVILQTDEGLNTLIDFRYKRIFQAEHGENGRSKNAYGKDGEDILLRVPVGTLVKDANTDHVIIDLNKPDMSFIIAHGGKGGRGNSTYKTSTRQAPNFAQSGYPGQIRSLTLELKLIADVALVGLPNVGKSTLLSIISNAKPKIANYHFTTLEPNLGVVNLGEGKSFVVADIPGLIEGASDGIGLGHDFLRHIERTKVLIHVLDGSGIEMRDPIQDFYKINNELKAYSKKLMEKPQIIFVNKMDIPQAQENVERIKKELGKKYTIFFGSAATTKNIKQMLYKVYEEVEKSPINYETYDVEYSIEDTKEEKIQVYVDGDQFKIEGPYIERLLGSTYFDDTDSLRYFQDNLRKKGVIDRLKELGIQDGMSVFICGYEFEFFE